MTKKFSFLKIEGFTEIGEGEEVPMSKKLSLKEFTVLQVIAMFQGKGGYCDTTQEQIASMTNMSLRSVQEAIRSLKNFRYEGKPVLEVSTKKNPYSKKEQNVYKLLYNKLFGVYGEKVLHADFSCNEQKLHADSAGNKSELHADFAGNEQGLHADFSYSKEIKDSKELSINKLIEEEDNMRELKNKDIITVFCESYKNKYLVDYKRNYKMDNKFTTKFKESVSDYKNNEIKRLVEIIVENYESWTTNLSKYPLTIRTLTIDWVLERAKAILEQEKKEKSQIEKQTVDSTKRNDISISSIMSRIKGGR